MNTTPRPPPFACNLVTAVKTKTRISHDERSLECKQRKKKIPSVIVTNEAPFIFSIFFCYVSLLNTQYIFETAVITHTVKAVIIS